MSATAHCRAAIHFPPFPSRISWQHKNFFIVRTIFLCFHRVELSSLFFFKGWAVDRGIVLGCGSKGENRKLIPYHRLSFSLNY